MRTCLFALLLAGCSQRQPQSEACAAYVSCVAAIDAARGTETDVVRYTPDGDCWGSPPGAELCDESCTRGLDWMAERWDDLPEACTP